MFYIKTFSLFAHHTGNISGSSEERRYCSLNDTLRQFRMSERPLDSCKTNAKNTKTADYGELLT